MGETRMLAAALAYAADGWPIFPVGHNKAPLNAGGVNSATTDITQIKEWWGDHPTANIGLNCGEINLMVLDFDPNEFRPMAKMLANLTENLGDIPATPLRAITPSGGEHWYYRLDEGEIVPLSSSKLAPGVDVRSFHSYVILPPSSTDAGKYEWTEEGEPTRRSDAMFEKATARVEKSQDRDEWIIEADLPNNVQWAIDWLTGKRPVRGDYIKPAIEGQGGDHMTYATAAMMKTLGISQPKAFELLWEHWNGREYCDPPWDAGELETKVENAYSYNTSPPGHLTPAYAIAKREQMFGAPEHTITDDGGHEWTSNGFRFRNRQAIENIPTPTWLVDNFIPEGGFAFIAGHYGTKKTFNAIDIALTIASGKYHAFGHTGVWSSNTKPSPVIFAAGEGVGNLRKRIKAWEATYNDGQPVENFYLCDPVPRILDGAGPAFIEAAKEQHDTYALVVIDTVGRAMQQTNENSQEAASGFTHMVELIQRELGAAVLALHHSGKDRGGLRGSSVFGADADVIIEAKPTKDPNSIALVMEKQKDAPEWDEPKGVSYRQHGYKSEKEPGTLVPFPSEAKVVVSREPKQERATETKAQGQLAAINEAVLTIMEGHPHEGFSSKRLAKAVEVYRREGETETIMQGLTWEAIRRTWLAKLRKADAAEYPASQLYNSERSDDKAWLYLN